MNILAIDTSNQVMGVAIMQDGNIAGELITNSNKDHSSRLMSAIVDVMGKVDIAPEQLDEIVVAHGPGSYTGTRIGVTTAKTMAWALQIPLKTVSSLEVLAVGGALFDGYICPFFDARRQTVFTALYQWEGKMLKRLKLEVNIHMEKWLASLGTLDKPILFLSPDLPLFKNMITETYPLAIFPEAQTLLARPTHLFTLAKHQKATPVHQAKPNYLRITEAEANLNKDPKGETRHG
jgi:tRNA threonylcarbamoyladenosine biosynthesis protein TsaB